MEHSAKPGEFARVERRFVVAEFDGGAVSSDAGGLLLGTADRAVGLVRCLASCFRDRRDARFASSNTRWPRRGPCGFSFSSDERDADHRREEQATDNFRVIDPKNFRVLA